jgi:aspartyl/asparaginyl beta-hydroxylase (cupin superfamily)
MSSDSVELDRQADRAAASGDPMTAARYLEQAAASAPDRMDLLIKLSAMRRAGGDFGGALEAIDRALALAPLDFSALLARAMLLERIGDPRAGAAFDRALAQQPDPADLPSFMAPALAHAREQADQHRSELEGRLAGEVPAGLSPAERVRLDRFITNSSRRTRNFAQEPSDFHYPGLPAIEFHDPAHFPQLEALQASTADVLAEFQALLAAEAGEIVPYIQYPDQVPLRQWKDLNHSRNWSAMHLLQNGRRIERNARHCPRTMALLGEMEQPQVPGACPNAMFSLLAPGTRIPPHAGVANTRLVCHLPLIVPPGCGFRVGASTREWRAGEAFVFDDTIEHEAWNEGNELRVVLIFDLWPPALSPAERAAVARLIPAAGVGFTGAL